jgi:hypothetical protein
VSHPAAAVRPLCADEAGARSEALSATASRVRHWLLVEYDGHWPYDPLDAAPFAGPLRERLREALAAARHAKLLLIKRPRRAERNGRTAVIYGETNERGSCFRRLNVERAVDVGDLDVGALLRGDETAGEPIGHPLLLVCTHGKRDRCCARYGQKVCEALQRHAPRGWAWQSSHVGGDRFAGNVVTMPEGLYFGRVEPDAVQPLIDAYRSGRIDLDHYRGRSCYAFPVQAAEIAVRSELGLDGLCDVSVGRVERTDDGWRVEITTDVAGGVYRVDVAVEETEPAFLTCRADTPRRARHFVARTRFDGA